MLKYVKYFVLFVCLLFQYSNAQDAPIVTLSAREPVMYTMSAMPMMASAEVAMPDSTEPKMYTMTAMPAMANEVSMVDSNGVAMPVMVSAMADSSGVAMPVMAASMAESPGTAMPVAVAMTDSTGVPMLRRTTVAPEATTMTVANGRGQTINYIRGSKRHKRMFFPNKRQLQQRWRQKRVKMASQKRSFRQQNRQRHSRVWRHMNRLHKIIRSPKACELLMGRLENISARTSTTPYLKKHANRILEIMADHNKMAEYTRNISSWLQNNPYLPTTATTTNNRRQVYNPVRQPPQPQPNVTIMNHHQRVRRFRGQPQNRRRVDQPRSSTRTRGARTTQPVTRVRTQTTQTTQPVTRVRTRSQTTQTTPQRSTRTRSRTTQTTPQRSTRTRSRTTQTTQRRPTPTQTQARSRTTQQRSAQTRTQSQPVQMAQSRSYHKATSVEDD